MLELCLQREGSLEEKMPPQDWIFIFLAFIMVISNKKRLTTAERGELRSRNERYTSACDNDVDVFLWWCLLVISFLSRRLHLSSTNTIPTIKQGIPTLWSLVLFLVDKRKEKGQDSVLLRRKLKVCKVWSRRVTVTQFESSKADEFLPNTTNENPSGVVPIYLIEFWSIVPPWISEKISLASWSKGAPCSLRIGIASGKKRKKISIRKRNVSWTSSAPIHNYFLQKNR